MSVGRVIVLNGPSSAGKSTLCKALQKTSDEYWWHVQMDTFTTMQPTWVMPEPAPGEKDHLSWNHEVRLAGFLSGYYQCIRVLALAGNNVIADAGFLKVEWLLEQIDALDGIDSLYVGVFCPLEEVERRELARGDRQPGYARSQYEVVHNHGPYDVEVDTSLLGPDEIARVIRKALATPPYPKAFTRILGRHRAK
ncbi:MAG: AAA family ATPase [Fibrella sp.]|nr:AAA family ATPase [Armatimonadota bacterium]